MPANKRDTRKSLTIGQVAARAGVNTETIRFYQRRRLLEQPERPRQGFRRYGEEAVARIRFIKRAQELGFTLKEAGLLLALEEGRSCAKARSLAGRKLDLIEARLADLTRLRRALKNLIAKCDVTAGDVRVTCPIISALTSRAL